MPDEPALCCIVIQGGLEATWSDYFGFLKASVEVHDGHVVSSTLSGFVPDLSAFMGVMARLSDSGVTVLSAAYRRVSAGV
jgi:hypothetical protein